jgi:hypothetical protein
MKLATILLVRKTALISRAATGDLVQLATAERGVEFATLVGLSIAYVY